MEWMRKMKRSLQRTADRAKGQHVPVAQDDTRAGSELERVAETARVPPADVFESEHEALLMIDLPGVPREHAQIHYDAQRHLLTVGGLAEGERFFARRFELPEHLDANEARAVLHHGVLTVHVPRIRGEPPKRVPIR